MFMRIISKPATNQSSTDHLSQENQIMPNDGWHVLDNRKMPHWYLPIKMQCLKEPHSKCELCRVSDHYYWRNIRHCMLIHTYRTIFYKYPDAWILDIWTNIYCKSDVNGKPRKLRSSTHESHNEKKIQIAWDYIFDYLEKTIVSQSVPYKNNTPCSILTNESRQRCMHHDWNIVASQYSQVVYLGPVIWQSKKNTASILWGGMSF